MKSSVFFFSLLLFLAGCDGMESLVPDTPSSAPDYFSTWNIQGYVVNYDYPSTSAAMDEKRLFGKEPLEGWAEFFPAFREDLLLLLDDSWDIPPGPSALHKQMMGQARLDTERFPSFTGEASARLGALVSKVKEKGWKGLGCWICAHESEAAEDKNDPPAYWTERLKESCEAGVSYWKVDYGDKCWDYDWRVQLTSLGRLHAPGMTIEHAFTEKAVESTDVFRTYDIEVVTAVPVTISRVAGLLRYKAAEGAKGLINCEDEPYIAAGLGCCLGVMRHPFAGALPDGTPDFVFPETCRNLKHRLDEVNRLLKWHRIAEPFGVNADALVDEHQLTDTWILGERETWEPSRHPGDTLFEKAPARVSRNLPLPVVECEEKEPPYVLVSEHPDGAIAVASVERVLGREWRVPLACVKVLIPDINRPIGVFGEYKTLELESSKAIGEKTRVLAQDLIGKRPVDITGKVTIKDNQIIIPREVIHSVGLSAATDGDKSAPGLVLKITSYHIQ